MRILPSGSTALLVELDGLDDVLGLYAALVADPLPGVVDVVPAARTVLLVTDPSAVALADVEAAVQRVRPLPGRTGTGESVELPVHYDGADLADVAALWDSPPTTSSRGTPARGGPSPSAASPRASATARPTATRGTCRGAAARGPVCRPARSVWPDRSAASTRGSRRAGGR